uniref:Uncharacterized protein n=1 Tax=Rhizophora mucronata TaxID=61149 RepID=A0A2P2PCP5_RHIMU
MFFIVKTDSAVSRCLIEMLCGGAKAYPQQNS